LTSGCTCAEVGKTTKLATDAAADAGEKAVALGGKVKELLKSKD
jgi:hypothetical protein